ncbi:hypothetical protein DERP_014829 [Dermatophagoides pteronyssinus]|uniref:Uncharacterized protein n=1 Tax=Dermatophagoides pteronyssinus TaxID=6956 RepID=A0ABQ8J2Y5_DERPT|nr:hypothetical protein DERP_014829 [Dermatophagoides pteronyssinus]
MGFTLILVRIDIGKTNFMAVKNQESRITLANNNSHPKKEKEMKGNIVSSSSSFVILIILI